MAEEANAVLKGAMRDLAVASKRVREARRRVREHALEEGPRYLSLVARLSEALDATEASLKEACRLCDTD